MKFINKIKNIFKKSSTPYILLFGLSLVSFFSFSGLALAVDVDPVINLVFSFIFGFFINLFTWVISLLLDLSAFFMTLADADNPSVHEVWVVVRDFINYSFILILIGSAISNIFSLNISGLEIRSIIPKVVFSMIMINFSYLFVRLILDFANVLEVTVYSKIGNMGPHASGFKDSLLGAVNYESWESAFKMTASANSDGMSENKWGFLIRSFVVMVLLGVLIIPFAAIALLFLTRVFYIWMLTITSPIYFFADVVPMLEKYKSDWFEKFTKWSFLHVKLAFCLSMSIAVAMKFSDASLGEGAKAGLNIAALESSEWAKVIFTKSFTIQQLLGTFLIAGFLYVCVKELAEDSGMPSPFKKAIDATSDYAKGSLVSLGKDSAKSAIGGVSGAVGGFISKRGKKAREDAEDAKREELKNGNGLSKISDDDVKGNYANLDNEIFEDVLAKENERRIANNKAELVDDEIRSLRDDFDSGKLSDEQSADRDLESNRLIDLKRKEMDDSRTDDLIRQAGDGAEKNSFSVKTSAKLSSAANLLKTGGGLREKLRVGGQTYDAAKDSDKSNLESDRADAVLKKRYDITKGKADRARMTGDKKLQESAEGDHGSVLNQLISSTEDSVKKKHAHSDSKAVVDELKSKNISVGEGGSISMDGKELEDGSSELIEINALMKTLGEKDDTMFSLKQYREKGIFKQEAGVDMADFDVTKGFSKNVAKATNTNDSVVMSMFGSIKAQNEKNVEAEYKSLQGTPDIEIDLHKHLKRHIDSGNYAGVKAVTKMMSDGRIASPSHAAAESLLLQAYANNALDTDDFEMMMRGKQIHSYLSTGAPINKKGGFNPDDLVKFFSKFKEADYSGDKPTPKSGGKNLVALMKKSMPGLSDSDAAKYIDNFSSLKSGNFEEMDEAKAKDIASVISSSVDEISRDYQKGHMIASTSDLDSLDWEHKNGGKMRVKNVNIIDDAKADIEALLSSSDFNPDSFDGGKESYDKFMKDLAKNNYNVDPSFLADHSSYRGDPSGNADDINSKIQAVIANAASSTFVNNRTASMISTKGGKFCQEDSIESIALKNSTSADVMEVVSVRGIDELIEINDSEALSKVVIGSQGKYQTKSAPQDYMPAINKLITKTDSDWKEDGHYTSSFNKKMKALRAQTWMNIAKDPNQQDAEKAPIRENHMARLRKNFSPDAAREFIENLDVEDMPDYYKDEKLIADMKVSFKDNPPKNADEMVKFLSDFKSRGNKEFVLRNNMSLKNTTKNIDTLSATLGSVSSVPDTASDKGAAISQLISDSANPGGEIVASIMKSVDGSGSSLEAQFSALDSTNPADDQKIKDLHKAIAVKIEKSKAQFEAQKIKQEAYANVNSIKI